MVSPVQSHAASRGFALALRDRLRSAVPERAVSSDDVAWIRASTSPRDDGHTSWHSIQAVRLSNVKVCTFGSSFLTQTSAGNVRGLRTAPPQANGWNMKTAGVLGVCRDEFCDG